MGTHGTLFSKLIRSHDSNSVTYGVYHCYLLMVNNRPTKVSHVSRAAEKLEKKCPQSVPESVPDFTKVSRMAVLRCFCINQSSKTLGKSSASRL